MSLSVTVRHHISAGHRIVGLDGPGAKCANPHGHTFGIDWTFAVPDSNATSVEFAGVKKVLRGWVDDHMDHGFFIYQADEYMVEQFHANGWKYYPLTEPSTTEAIASEIARVTRELLPEFDLVSVVLTEGPHNAATWTA